ncbi:MAG: hypothetical protein WCO42_10340 [bacterium]
MIKKALLVTMAFLNVALASFGKTNETSPSATALLNKELVPLYQDLVSGVAETNIVGRTLDLSLKLKVCYGEFLLFHDAQVVVDNTTKYHLIKWKYSKEDINAIKGRTNIKCHIKGRIIEVCRGNSTPYPYVKASIERIDAEEEE